MNFSNIENILKNNNFKFIHLKSTKSTMQDSKIYLNKYKSNLFILADEQREGKGQRGNKWESPYGNIYCSIVINNSLDLDKYFLFSMLTAVSIKICLSRLGVSEIKFKWPNDILYKKRKFGGIILEPYNIQKSEQYVIIGLGINFNSSPLLTNYNTTYIKEFVQVQSKNLFLENFLKIFLYLCSNLNNEQIRIFSDFHKSLLFLNEKIEITTSNNQVMKGIFKGIRNDGSLILDIDDKSFYIYSGRIKI